MLEVLRDSPFDAVRVFVQMHNVEVVYFLGKGWLHVRMLHQELVKKTSTALLRSDNDKLWQRSYWSSTYSPKMPGQVSLFAASLHN